MDRSDRLKWVIMALSLLSFGAIALDAGGAGAARQASYAVQVQSSNGWQCKGSVEECAAEYRALVHDVREQAPVTGLRSTRTTCAGEAANCDTFSLLVAQERNR
jgi:hypothetical protein